MLSQSTRNAAPIASRTRACVGGSLRRSASTRNIDSQRRHAIDEAEGELLPSVKERLYERRR